MIENKETFVLQSSSFKRLKNVLYEDFICSDLSSFYVNDFTKFNNGSSIYKVDTSFKSYYFQEKDAVTFIDFLTKGQVKDTVSYLSTLDLLPIQKRDHGLLSDKIRFIDKLYLNTYDYSVSFADIVSKYKLPRGFLLKALTTGCPDNEYPGAEEHNKTLNKILDDNNVTLDEFKAKLLESYSKKPQKQSLTLNYKLLDLVYLCITGNYELLSHTTVKLKIKDKSVFENVIKFLIAIDAQKTIYNDIYNTEEYSIILVNSNLVHSLFKSCFNNFNFILSMSDTFTKYLLNKIKDIECFETTNDECLAYLQEFLFRFELLYKEIQIDNIKYLVKDNDSIVLKDTILVKIENISKVENPFNYLGVS